MSDLYGDAFKDDKREERLFGDDIVETHTVLDYAALPELPQSKSNNVSFMKVEDLARDCRNILAVSESNICYSVTQKKNLLRIIDTERGDKVILRGHEHFVVDLCFAIADATLLCSADNGEDASAGKPHIIVWKRGEQGDWKVFAELPLRATLVRPHPQQGHLWLIARGGSLGVFSSQRSSAQPAASYEGLPLHAELAQGEVVLDAVFSSSGRHVAVVAGSADGSGTTALRVYRVTSTGLVRLYSEASETAVPLLKAVQWVGDRVITVSSCVADTKDGASCTTVDYSVRVWQCLAERDEESEAPRELQTVTLRLPRSAQGQGSSSLQNLALECALSAEPGRQRYLLLSSRRSNLVAVLAVNPSGAGPALYHATCLDLRAPVVSVGVTTVLGQAHHSAEAGEHLEVSCYQESASADPAQASIQQYHVLFAQVFDFAAYSALPHMQKAAAVGASAAASSPSPVVADQLSGGAAGANGSSKGMTILNMLNSFGRGGGSSGSPATPSTPAPVPALAPAAPVTPSALPSPGIVRPGSAGGAGSGTATPTSSAPAFSGKAALDALLSGKKVSQASTPAPLSTQGLPDFLQRTQSPANTSILNVLKAASAAKAVAPVAAPASIPSTRAPPAAAVVPASSPTPPSPLQALSAKKAAQAAAQKAPVPTAATVTAAIPPSPLPTLVSAGESAESVARLFRELQVSFASAQEAQHRQALESLQQHQQLAAKQLQQSAKELQAAQSKHSEGLVAAIKKAVETEARRVQDSSSASAGTMRVEMSEQIMKELIPSVTAKVRDSVRDTVRDAVKSQLPVAFRDSFESALLPAFEAGAQAMFQQLQSAFAQGMQGVMQEGLRAQQREAAHTARLEQEVRDLRDSVGRLEGTVSALADLLRTGTAGMAALGGESPQTEAEADDAFALLKKGRISDAVVRVLEDKDIAVTVALLEQLTPAQVAGACSRLERLCITQQLAADMSVNIPVEGIGKRVDWIKSLVLSLVSGSGKGSSAGRAASPEDPHYAEHFGAMIGVVLDSISSAKRLIYSAQFDTGEDDGLSALQIPQSVGTDLHLLEFVIQSQMK